MKFKEGIGPKLIVRFIFISLPLIVLILVCGLNYLSVDYSGVSLDGEPWAGLNGDTIYLTLMNLVIAIYTLAVTAFIFLATALMERREKYEQETIRIMLRKSTSRLLILSVISTVCIIGCLVVERTENCLLLVKRGISFLSIIDFILLLIYSFSIIDYENQLVVCAKSEREKLEKWAMQQGDVQHAVSYQMLGDLSMIVDRLLENHAKEYHNIESEQVLIAVTKRHPNFAKKYLKLIQYRDFLRVESRNAAIPVECAPQLWYVLQELENALKTELLLGESLTDMFFAGNEFFKTDKPFDLTGTVLSDSFFSNFSFADATLRQTDMSRTRLFAVDMSNAKCDEAVFADAVWNKVTLTAESSFDKATFRDVDFNGQTFRGRVGSGAVKLLKLTNTSFVHANMLNCELSYVNLEHANLRNALLSGAKINTVSLSFADLGGAILTQVSMMRDNQCPNVFPIKDFVRNNQRDGDTPVAGFELQLKDGTLLCPAFYANLEDATLTESKILQINWNGSRIANCNFTFSAVGNCIFDSCYGKNVTFRDAEIKKCSFRYAMLNTADLSYTQMDGCDFTDGNLQDSLFVHMRSPDKSADICNTKFVRTVFSGSQFQGSVFRNCDFTGARFDNTSLINVHFINCDFCGANFEHANLMSVSGIPSVKIRTHKCNRVRRREWILQKLRIKH